MIRFNIDIQISIKSHKVFLKPLCLYIYIAYPAGRRNMVLYNAVESEILDAINKELKRKQLLRSSFAILSALRSKVLFLVYTLLLIVIQKTGLSINLCAHDANPSPPLWVNVTMQHNSPI